MSQKIIKGTTIGIGKYSSTIDKKPSKFYLLWSGMVKRCYLESSLIKYDTYRGCSVEESWLNFQNFAEWCETNYIEGFELDKDLLVKGNKIYSKETCCFIPKIINNSLTKREKDRGNYPIGIRKKTNYEVRVSFKGKSINVGTFKTIDQAFIEYKKVKEQLLKDLAEEYKDRLPNKVYKALYNYEYLITD